MNVPPGLLLFLACLLLPAFFVLYLLAAGRVWRRWPWLAKPTRCKKCKFIGNENSWRMAWIKGNQRAIEVCKKCGGWSYDYLEFLDDLEVAVWKGERPR